MKRFSTLLLTAALSFGAALSTLAQTADQIAQKHLTAIGGADAWNKVNTMKMTGAISAQGMEIPLVITSEHNKGMRVQFTVMGMDNYMIMTPTGGWNYMPVGGQTKPEPMTEEMVKTGADQLDIRGDFLDYAKKGYTLEAQGKEDIEGTECLKLLMKKKNGVETAYFIDPSNYYIVRSVTKATIDGKEQEQTQNYSNYQKLPEGIVVPMSMEGPEGPVTLKSVEVNKPVDPKMFEPKAG